MASSSHINQKRFWPGVPNRYSTYSSRMVIRPKSIATVVVFLPSTPDKSSTPTLWSVRISSVCSGRVSEMAETKVVLPTPKPPATRILIALGIIRSPAGRSERPELIEHHLVHPLVSHVHFRLRLLFPEEALAGRSPTKDPTV